MEIAITPTDVRRRSEVSSLVKSNHEKAVEIARSIKHPWYRCQSLAYAAEAADNKNLALTLINEAFEAAFEQSEINRIVTVASWPLQVCVNLVPELASKKLAELLGIASKEPHTLRRADALHSIVFAVAGSPELKARALVPHIAALISGHGWRIERLIADAAILVCKDHPEHLAALLLVHPENRRKRKLLEALNELGVA